MGKMSRDKGKAYECHVASLFRQAGWASAKRHLEVQAAEAEAGRDIDATQPFAVQAKCWKSTPSISALLEIVTDGEYELPMAVLKRTQSKGVKGLEVAVFPLDLAMTMLWMLQRSGTLETLQALYAVWQADFEFSCPKCGKANFDLDGEIAICDVCGFEADVAIFFSVGDADG